MTTEQWGLHNLAQVLSPIVGWELLSMAGWGIVTGIAYLAAIPFIVKYRKVQEVTITVDIPILTFLITSSILTTICGVTLFTLWIPDYTINRIASALAVGAGAVLIQRIVEK